MSPRRGRSHAAAAAGSALPTAVKNPQHLLNYPLLLQPRKRVISALTVSAVGRFTLHILLQSTYATKLTTRFNESAQSLNHIRRPAHIPDTTYRKHTLGQQRSICPLGSEDLPEIALLSSVAASQSGHIGQDQHCLGAAALP